MTPLVVALAFTFLAGISAEKARIVGGEPTSIDLYPSIVQVDFYNVFSSTWGQSCAGNVLNEAWILSAAQCFSGTFYASDMRRIRAGSSNRNTGGVIVEVLHAVLHPEYGTSIEYNADIALVRLTSYLTYSPAIRPVTIITPDYQVDDNVPVVQAGWGYTAEEGYASPDLLEVEVYTINREECAAKYEEEGYTISENMICTGVPEGGRDACTGDNGGPTYYGDILIGIISWGVGCGEAEFPRVNTKVSSYTQWIVDNAQ